VVERAISSDDVELIDWVRLRETWR